MSPQKVIERKDIVAYLRKRSKDVDPATGLFIRDLAREIEDGRHEIVRIHRKPTLAVNE